MVLLGSRIAPSLKDPNWMKDKECNMWVPILGEIWSKVILIIKGSLDEKLPSYEVLKMLRE